MSIAIKGIEMPTNCTRCPFSDDGSRFCRAANEYIPMLGKPNFCPLVETEERKTGRWTCSDDLYETAICSCCGWDTTEPWGHIRNWFMYCPNCGAKMEVEHETD